MSADSSGGVISRALKIASSILEIDLSNACAISKIEEAILSALEMTPPELSADIYKTGIYLAGGVISRALKIASSILEIDLSNACAISKIEEAILSALEM